MKRGTLVVAAFASCLDPTEIFVVIDSNVDCAEILQVEIFTGKSTTPNAETHACANGHVGDIVLVPSGTDDGPVDIRVVATLKAQPPADCAANPASGCIEARRRLGYVKHTPLHLPIALNGQCKNVVCADPDTTCVEGTCVQKTIDPEKCKTVAGCDQTMLPMCPGGIPKLNAVSAWHFDERMGTMTSAIGAGGTIPLGTGASFTPNDPCGSALVFASAIMPMQLLDGSTFKPSTALAVWMRFRTMAAGKWTLVSMRTTTNGFDITLDNGAPHFSLAGPGGTFEAGAPGMQVADGKWHSVHVEWRASSGDASLRIDEGPPLTGTALIGTLQPLATPLVVGLPNGAIDDVYLYDTAQ